MSRVGLLVGATGALLVLGGFASANGLGGATARSHIHFFSYNLGDQAPTRGDEPQFGAFGPLDLASAIEGGDDEDGFYDRFEDQIETVLAARKPVDPASDRSKWMILLIAFAALTAATSGPRRARRATLPI